MSYIFINFCSIISIFLLHTMYTKIHEQNYTYKFTYSSFILHIEFHVGCTHTKLCHILCTTKKVQQAWLNGINVILTCFIYYYALCYTIHLMWKKFHTQKFSDCKFHEIDPMAVICYSCTLFATNTSYISWSTSVKFTT